jgi:hypothetical protein
MAIQLLADLSFPQNNETQFPIGQQFYLAFDNAVDLKSVKESVIVYGPDFDRTSGPNNSLWINASSGENPYFLRSPGFKGFVECEFEELTVLDTTPVSFEEGVNLIDRSEIRTLIKVTPKEPLKENTSYSLFLVGSNIENIDGLPDVLVPISKNKCITERTIYSPSKLGVLETRVSSYGSYEPKNNEQLATLNIKIVTAGVGSEAKYVWWFSDEVEPAPAQAYYSQRLSRCVQRWRSCDRGVMVKFEQSSFSLNESFTIKCYSKVKLVNSYLINFKTGTDSIYVYPEYTSTSPIGVDESLIPQLPGGVVNPEELRVVSITPYDGAINVDLGLKQIVIEFNKNLDASTITQSSVELLSYPVSGTFDGPNGTRSDRERKVFKIISVEDNKIILEL